MTKITSSSTGSSDSATV